MNHLIFFISLLFLGISHINPLVAQWVRTNGPYGGNVLAFAVSGSNVLAGTYGGGAFFSTNNGASWNEVNSGLSNTKILSLVASGSNLFAGTEGGGIFISSNN